MENQVAAQMLIRKPVEEVFRAFVDPEVTKEFWFTNSTGKLVEGQSVTWSWDIYGISEEVFVSTLDINKRIVIDWSTPKSTVEILFDEKHEEQTYVEIKCYGFSAEDDKLIATVSDLVGGFTTVLDGLKAFLEHGINLNLIADKYPDKNVKISGDYYSFP